MKDYDVVIIGGSAAGLTASITAKRFYPEKKVLIVRKEKNVLIPFGIPYIYGSVDSIEKDLIPDAILEKNGIELLIGNVSELNKDEHLIKTTENEIIKYEKLIIATGSEPAVPPIKGADLKGVFTIKKDVQYLAALLEEVNNARDMVIIGGGFIGIEFADECKKNRDINLSVVEMLPHCLILAFDEEFCIQGENIIKESGVNLITSEKVEEIIGNERVQGVSLSSKKTIKADVVLIGIGSKPNSGLAQKAGIEVNNIGFIKVNRYMQTSGKDIFACGDCCNKKSFFNNKPVNYMLASIATNEARIAGANLYKINRANDGVIGTYSTVIGDTALARTGLSVSEAEIEGYDYIVGQAEGPNCHPGCMPGGKNLKVSLIFEKGTGIIIGGELIGAKSGGELINLISGCIAKKMTANDIATFQMGTHPALTASPIAYQISNAAEIAVKKLRE